MTTKHWEFLSIVVQILAIVQGDGGGPIVQTPLGSVQGTIKKSYNNRSYVAFEGVPYAKPPVGDLRFERPEPVEKWDGTLVANKTYLCAQFLPIPGFGGPKGVEDCLYLYIYIPEEKFSPSDKKLDVVIHIHAGIFMFGAPKYFARPDFIMDKDVIYVTMTYRLGLFGFLSTQDDVVPGNNGLKDQSLALHWIKDNIEYFGGNSDSITLTGHSAGGASVQYHYLSKQSWGLFNRGFSMSGTVLNPWALNKSPGQNAKLFASKVDCPYGDDSREMVNCLRKLSANTLLNGVKNMCLFMDSIPFTLFGPVVEKGVSDGFLMQHPYKLLRDKDVYDVPWINANVKDEGILPVGFFVQLGMINALDSNWTYFMPYTLNYRYTVDDSKLDDVSGKIREYYFKNEHLTKENIYTLIRLFGDRLFFDGSEKAIRLHSKAVKSPVYYYMYYYMSDQPFGYPIKPGVGHCADSKLMFRMITGTRLSEKDAKMVDVLTQFVADYARTGIPTINGVEWKPLTVDSDQIDYLQISSLENISMTTADHLLETDLWNHLPIEENDALFE